MKRIHLREAIRPEMNCVRKASSIASHPLGNWLSSVAVPIFLLCSILATQAQSDVMVG